METTITVDHDVIKRDVRSWYYCLKGEMYQKPWTGLQLETVQKLRARINADDGVYFLQRLLDALI